MEIDVIETGCKSERAPGTRPHPDSGLESSTIRRILALSYGNRCVILGNKFGGSLMQFWRWGGARRGEGEEGWSRRAFPPSLPEQSHRSKPVFDYLLSYRSVSSNSRGVLAYVPHEAYFSRTRELPRESRRSDVVACRQDRCRFVFVGSLRRANGPSSPRIHRRYSGALNSTSLRCGNGPWRSELLRTRFALKIMVGLESPARARLDAHIVCS